MPEFGPLFHGSRHSGLDRLDPKCAGTGVVSYSAKRPVVWFSSERDAATYYADPEGEESVDDYVYRAFVTLENPLVIPADTEDHKPPSQWLEIALSRGHDGVIVKDCIDGPLDVSHDVYGVPSAAQIRMIR